MSLSADDCLVEARREKANTGGSGVSDDDSVESGGSVVGEPLVFQKGRLQMPQQQDDDEELAEEPLFGKKKFGFAAERREQRKMATIEASPCTRRKCTITHICTYVMRLREGRSAIYAPP